MRGEILVDALDRNDLFINGLDMRSSIVDPDSQTHHISLEQIAPGPYRGDFGAPKAGRYYFNLSGIAAGRRVGPRTFGLAIPYSSEYLDLKADHELLEDIADTTGGQVLALSSQSLPMVMSPESAAVSHQARIWWPAFLTALVFLLLEIMVRKVALPEPWRLRLQRVIDRRRPGAATEPGYDELLASIAEVRKKHLEALHDGARFRPDDPAVRAHLYLSSTRR